MTSTRPSRNAFTLIELLVVVAIIGMLMALLLVAVQSAIRNAQTARSRNNGKEIAKAITMYATNNNLMLPAPDAARFTSFTNHLTFGGGMSANPNRVDPNRPLFAYIKDSSVFSCGNDRGYSGKDGAVSSANTSMFRTYGTSYIYPLNDVTSCGLVGLFDSTKSTARRITDPMLLSSSNKVLVYQASFAGPAGKPDDARDRWHDNSVRAGVAGFMDGHADLLKAPSTQTNHATVPATVDAFTLLNPARTYY